MPIALNAARRKPSVRSADSTPRVEALGVLTWGTQRSRWSALRCAPVLRCALLWLLTVLTVRCGQGSAVRVTRKGCALGGTKHVARRCCTSSPANTRPPSRTWMRAKGQMQMWDGRARTGVSPIPVQMWQGSARQVLQPMWRGCAVPVRMLQRRASGASAVRGCRSGSAPLERRETTGGEEPLRRAAVDARAPAEHLDAHLVQARKDRDVPAAAQADTLRADRSVSQHPPPTAPRRAAPRHAVAASAPPALIVRPKKPAIGRNTTSCCRANRRDCVQRTWSGRT